MLMDNKPDDDNKAEWAEGLQRDDSLLQKQPEFVSPQVIQELKALGHKRPDWVSATAWAAEKTAGISFQQDLVVHMIAGGSSIKQAAEQVQMTPQTIRKWLKDPVIANEIYEIRNRIYGEDIRKRIDSMLHNSLDTLQDVLTDPTAKDQTKASVAMYLLDQGVGKAKQEIQVQGSMYAQLLSELDKRKVGSPDEREVKKLEGPKDPIDDFADSFVQSFTVGTKNATEEK